LDSDSSIGDTPKLLKVSLVWPNYITNWQNQVAIDIPFIDVSDEELEDVDEGYSEEATLSDEYCTNTGIVIDMTSMLYAIKTN
jgi:hypothetical protein